MALHLNMSGFEYSSPDWFHKEKSSIFRTSWQLMGGANKLCRNGDFIATNIAGIPIFIIRGQDGKLRAFINVCPHRGSPLFKEEAGNCSEIVCPYHAAKFGDDGNFEMAGDWFGQPVPPELAAMQLDEISVEEWNGLAFVAIAPVEELLDQLGDAVSQVGSTPISDYTHTESRHLVIDANWKCYFDQYNEIWHTPQIHPSDKNIGILDYAAEAMNGLIRMTTGSEEGAEGAYYGGKWLQCWPNWTLVLFEGGMKTVRINPLSATKFEAFHNFWFDDAQAGAPDLCRKAVDATIDIFLQDATLCESVMPSYISGAYRPGPMHATLEAALIENQRRIRNAVERE